MPALPHRLEDALAEAVAAIRTWERGWDSFETHPSLEVDPARFEAAWEAYRKRLTGNYPFFHPRYAGQLLKPPHPAAVLGYVTAMLINPNNHALDGGPPTGEMEKEIVRRFAAMFGLPQETLGHLTSGGTVANLEALWVARNLHPAQGIAYSADAHYTHARMCALLGVEGHPVPTDDVGRIDLDALETLVKTGRVGTVVLTPGTTGFGAVDRIDEALALRDRYGLRLHVDASYGGFFVLLAEDDDPLVPVEPFRAIRACDSVVVDPHKHGLQPYGSGCVLFRDPAVGRFYKHDSPYTYFTSGELHLGEISLECSRAGASAGALWFTLECIPLTSEGGLGDILRGSLCAARDWSGWIERSDVLWRFQEPELDILTFFPRPRSFRVSAVDEATEALFEAAMTDPHDPVYLSLLKTPAGPLCDRIPDLEEDAPEARILRSVLMKPEHEDWVATLHECVEAHAAAILAA